MSAFDEPLLQVIGRTLFGSPTPPKPQPANVATPPASPVKTAPEATTANVKQPSAAEVAAAESAAATTHLADGTGGTAAFFNSIREMIDTNTQENCLNSLYQSTYHFRLFMAPDTDMITQTGATSITGLNDGMNNIRQITIAESGVTGFNIKDVSFTATVAGNSVTRGDAAHSFTMTITEPGGISFLDAMILASAGLKIKNYTKAPFYLELTFLGYDEEGKFVNNPASGFGTAGRWTWALTCQDIVTKLSEAGATYTVTFQVSNSAYLTDVYDLTRTPQSFFAVGKDIETLFADYTNKLNDAWRKKYNGDLVVFDGIETSAVGKYFTNPAAATGSDPGTFQLKDNKPQKNPNRSWVFDNAHGTYSVNVTPGYTVSEFIMDAIKNTNEGQNLAKADNNATAADASEAQVNANNIRESITWVVEPVLKVKEFDRNSGNYIKHITFVVSPYYTQGVTLTRPQADNGKGPDQQKNMVQNYIQNGLFRKKYEYIFTGLNTEVLDFDLSWKLQYNAKVGNYSGALMRLDAFKPNERLSDENKNPQANLSQVNDNKVHSEPLVQVSAEGKETVGVPAAAPESTSKFMRVAPGPPTPEGKPAARRIFIEDLLSQQTADNPEDYAVPISFWQGNLDVENNAGGSNFVGQMDRVRTIAGAVFAQIYDQNLPSNAFQSVKLTIRGDPYWLGQSNLHRQILLLRKDLNVKQHDLPNYATGQQVIYIHFRYPVQTRDDFKPELNDSTAFNGLYSVSNVVHHFSDGVFKQELNCVKLNLVDPTKWVAGPNSAAPSAANGNSAAASSPQQVGTSGAVPPSSGPRASSIGLANSPGFKAQAPALTQKLMADFNLTQDQAAGIVGNLGYESAGLQSNINERSGGGGFGWAQWTGSRRTDLIDYANQNNLDVSSPDAQYGFLKQELSTTHASSITALRNTNNIADATTSFQNTFERPAAATANTAARINLAQQASQLVSATPPIVVASEP